VIRAGTKSVLTTAADLPALEILPHGSAPHNVRGHAPRIGLAYIAPTAVLAGDVSVADDASVFFGCVVIADGARVSIGPRANVQDNSLLVTGSGRGDLVVGADVTIGHNVRMGAALIAENALIGMGSQLADGVVVEPGGCIGARAWVEAGTVVKAGWIWAGRPARAFRQVKPDERDGFAEGVAVYVGYATAYRTQASKVRERSGGS
jgi:carbonic anhydrase/acetyltransferase-like protein (isoleucine patch superfamily)